VHVYVLTGNQAQLIGSKGEKMNIKVLGPGCKKCHQTETIVKEAVAEADASAVVDYVTDIAEIAKHGVFSTPAVVIDGVVKCTGKVPTKAEVRGWLGK
jgi:small redox-active disulfide protein 2